MVSNEEIAVCEMLTDSFKAMDEATDIIFEWENSPLRTRLWDLITEASDKIDKCLKLLEE